MDTLFLYNTKTLKEKFKTKVFAGDNHITKIAVQIPDNIGGYPKSECEYNLRAIISEGNLSYIINPNEPYFYITNDITEKAQTVKLMMIITHEGNVIGRTNTVDLIVNEPAEAPDPPLTPREEFDEVIAEQRAEIAEQVETISAQTAKIAEKNEEISEKSAQITELSDDVTELSTENTRLENLADTQRETIQNMLDNPPQPKLYTPPEPIIPESETRVYTPPQNYDGFASFTVDRVTAEGVGFNPEWYKEGKECLGKIGTYNPFPEHSVGGIYITEVDEDGYPVKFLVKNYEKTQSEFPQFFDKSQLAIRALREIVFENCPNIMTFQNQCFANLTYLRKIILPNHLTTITINAFSNCRSLAEISLPNSLVTLNYQAFINCSELKKIVIPNSLQTIGNNVFLGCTSLTNLNLAQGFNCNNLNVSWSTRFTAETIVACLEALADRTGQTAYTITFGTTNLNKLTAEEKAIATNKNWNLA